MAKFDYIVQAIKHRLSKKKPIQVIRKPLSYEEVIKRYEELSI